MARFGQNNENFSLSTVISNLEAIRDSEQDLQEPEYSEDRAESLNVLERAIGLLYECLDET